MAHARGSDPDCTQDVRAGEREPPPIVSRTFARLARQAAFHDAGHGYDVFGLDPRLLVSAVDLAAPLYERYFRVQSHGVHAIPSSGPVIVIANHGGALPLDAALLCLDLLRRTDPPRIPRAVTDRFVAGLPLFSTLMARLGAVTGTRSNVRTLLERGELVVIWPEGVTGPGKPYRERYKLQRWSTGFAELAIRYHAPVVPVAIVGAEDSWPVLAKLRLSGRPGPPHLPITTPFPLPVRFRLRYGAAIELHHGDDPSAADDPDVVANAATRAQVALEHLLDTELRARHGGVW